MKTGSFSQHRSGRRTFASAAGAAVEDVAADAVSVKAVSSSGGRLLAGPAGPTHLAGLREGRRLAWAVAVVAVMLLPTGCVNVKPWERGTLADYTMRPDRDPLTAALGEHMWFSREAASGGAGVGGGGCGCN